MRVYVQRGDIVAVLDASHKALPLGESVEIDASLSYDEDEIDVSAMEVFSYTWSCTQLLPTLSEVCPLDLTTNSTRAILVARTGSLATTAVVTLLLEDRSASSVDASKRRSSTSVTVEVTESTTPLISFTTIATDKFNAAKKTKLKANVLALSSCEASWSFSEDGLAFDTKEIDSTLISTSVSEELTVTEQNGQKQNFNVNLVLKANALQAGKTYDFVLSCTPSVASGAQASSNTITISMNDAPSPGTLDISPSSGIELSTLFLLEASFWNDDDLPLRYDFGFVTLAGDISSLTTPPSDSSRKSTVFSRLSSNSDANEEVVIVLRVYDKYFAESSLVNTLLLSTAGDIIESLTDLLESEDVDEGSINILSGKMNAKDCAAATPAFCALRHREKCFNHVNVCGKCLTGYFGENKGTSICLTQSELDSISNTRMVVSGVFDSVSAVCDAVTCAPWYHCKEVNGEGVCERDLKECPGTGECSGHGSCVYTSSSLETVSACYMGAVGCSASCVCSDGYKGDACSYLSADFIAKQKLRYESILTFQSLLLTQDNSLVQIESNINQIISLSQEQTELTEAAIVLIFDLLQTVMLSVNEIATSSDELSKLFEPLGIVSDTSLSSSNLTFDACIALVDELSYHIASDMTVGETDIDVINTFYRAKFSAVKQSTGVNESFQTFQSAVSTTEEVFGLSPSELNLFSTEAMSVDDSVVSWVLTIPFTVTETAHKWNSNIMRVSFLIDTDSATDTLLDNSSFSINLPNLNSQSYSNSSYVKSGGNWGYTIATACSEGTLEDILVHCPNSGYQTTVYCDGTVSSVSSIVCPPIAVKVFPVCTPLAGANVSSTQSCDLVSYDQAGTTCRCSMTSAQESNIGATRSSRRRLNTLGTLLTLEFSSFTATSTSYEVSNIVTDLQLTEDLEKLFNNNYEAGVVTLYAITAVIGALFVCLLSGYRVDYLKGETVDAKPEAVYPTPTPTAQKAPTTIADGVGNAAVAAEVVDKPLPLTFRASRPSSTFGRINAELMRSYKWTRLLTALISMVWPSSGFSSNMLHESIYFLCDVISAVMMTTVVYVWLEPSTIEDGSASCFEQHPMDACRSSRGYVWFGDRCEWLPETEECTYKDTFMVKYSMAVGAYLAAILTLLLSNILQSILKDYVFVPTLKIEKGGQQDNWLSHCLPSFLIQWLAKKRTECKPDSFWELLYKVPVGFRYDQMYDSALSDMIVLEKRLVAHRRLLPYEAKKIRFSDQWNLDAEYDSWACTVDDSNALSDLWDGDIPINYKLSGFWNVAKSKFQKRNEMNPEDIFLKELMRVYRHVYEEQDSILHKLQVSNTPLDEMRVLKLLFEDLLSDDECVIFNAKCCRDDETILTRPVPQRMAVKIAGLTTVLCVLLGGVVLVVYFAVATVDAIQKQWLVSLLGCFLLDIVVVQPMRIIVEDVLVPSLIANKIFRLKALLVRLITNMDDHKPLKEKFNWSLMLYASARVASKFYSSRISELIFIVALNSPRRSNTIHAYSNKAINEKTVLTRRLYFVDLEENKSVGIFRSFWLFIFSRHVMKSPLLRSLYYDFVICLLSGGAMVLQVRLYVELGRYALIPCVLVGGVLFVYIVGNYISLLVQKKWRNFESVMQQRKLRLQQGNDTLQRRTDARNVRRPDKTSTQVGIEPNEDNDEEELSLVLEDYDSEHDIPVATHAFDSRSTRVQPMGRSLGAAGQGPPLSSTEHNRARVQPEDMDPNSSSFNSTSNLSSRHHLKHMNKTAPAPVSVPAYTLASPLPSLTKQVSWAKPLPEHLLNDQDLDEQLNALMVSAQLIQNDEYNKHASEQEDDDDLFGDNNFDANDNDNDDLFGDVDNISEDFEYYDPNNTMGWVDSILSPSKNNMSDDNDDDSAIASVTVTPTSVSAQKMLPVVSSNYKPKGNLLLPAPTPASLRGEYKRKQRELLKEDEFRVSTLVEQYGKEDESLSVVSGVSDNVDNTFYLSAASGNKKPRSVPMTTARIKNKTEAERKVPIMDMDIEEFDSSGDDDDYVEDKLHMLDSVMSTLSTLSTEKKE